MIINLTGQAGAGKTTIAKELLKVIPNSINIDGDELREIFKNKDYTEKGRRNNIQNAYNIALFMEQQGFTPIISLISPYRDLREDLKSKNNVLEFYIFTTEKRGRENFHVYDYEIPLKNSTTIDTTFKNVSECVNIILDFIPKTYNMFIGRYQSPHKGHQTIFNEYLDKKEPILIAIRDVATDENNPLTATEVKEIWETIYMNNPLVKVIIIPDIASVNYGRGVGYEVKEIEVSGEIANISATNIRNQIKDGLNVWKDLVDEKAHYILEQLLKNK